MNYFWTNVRNRDWFIYMAIKVYKKKENWKLSDLTALKQSQK